MKGKKGIPNDRRSTNSRADQWWLLVRSLLLGLSFALFVMQHEPGGDLRSATITFNEVARSTYLSVYLVAGNQKYSVLVDNDKVDDFLYNYRNGGTVTALLRSGDGIVELRHSGMLLYSYEDYRRLYLEPKKQPRRWMCVVIIMFLLTLIIRRI